MFQNGRPMSGVPVCSGERTEEVAQTVTSVGPYTLVTEAAVRARRSARAAGSASPPTRTLVRARARGAPSSRRACHSDGVACMTVGRWASTRAARAAGSRTVSRPARTTAAPLISGTWISRAAMSKETVVTATSPSPGLMASSWACMRRKLASAECGITTPLGRPVEPEVWMTYAGWAPSGTGSGPAGSSAGSARADRASGESRTRVSVPGTSGASAAAARVVRTHTGRASSTMNSRRSAGYSRSSGR